METTEIPPELLAAIQNESPAAQHVIQMVRWTPSVTDEGYDADGAIVRCIQAMSMDFRTQVVLSGIGVNAASQIAALLTAPYERASGLVTPPESKIVVPGR